MKTDNEISGEITINEWQLLISSEDYKLIQNFIGKQSNVTTKVIIDWNYLIPIVDDIEDLDDSKKHYQWEDLDGTNRSNFGGYEVDINYYDCRIWLNLELDPPQLITHTKCDSRIEATCKAIVEFIKWYNQQKS